MSPQHILGISAFYHDSAACLLRDGEIVAAAQEERFTRKKGDSSFPRHAVDYCLSTAGIHQINIILYWPNELRSRLSYGSRSKKLTLLQLEGSSGDW